MASPWTRPVFKGNGLNSSPFTPRQSLNYSSFLGDSAKRFVGMYKAQRLLLRVEEHRTRHQNGMGKRVTLSLIYDKCMQPGSRNRDKLMH